jgi:hypothetical protein
MVCSRILCYSLDARGLCERSHAPSPVRAPSKPPPPVIWFNDPKIIDAVDITQQGLKGVRRGWGDCELESWRVCGSQAFG